MPKYTVRLQFAGGIEVTTDTKEEAFKIASQYAEEISDGNKLLTTEVAIVSEEES